MTSPSHRASIFPYRDSTSFLSTPSSPHNPHNWSCGSGSESFQSQKPLWPWHKYNDLAIFDPTFNRLSWTNHQLKSLGLTRKHLLADVHASSLFLTTIDCLPSLSRLFPENSTIISRVINVEEHTDTITASVSHTRQQIALEPHNISFPRQVVSGWVSNPRTNTMTSAWLCESVESKVRSKQHLRDRILIAVDILLSKKVCDGTCGVNTTIYYYKPMPLTAPVTIGDSMSTLGRYLNSVWDIICDKPRFHSAGMARACSVINAPINYP